jgi:ABC-2 type transport system permease protein
VRNILVLAAGLMRLELRDRSTFVWMLVMPIAFITLFGGMFREGAGPRTALTLVDEDGTFLSRSLVDALRTEADLKLEVVAPGAAADSAGSGADRIRTLRIPAGFSDSLAAGQRVSLRLESKKGSSQENTLAAKVYVYKAMARVLANLTEIDTVRAEHHLATDTKEFQERYAELTRRPELIATVVSTAGKGKALPTGFAGSAQSMLVLFLLINTTVSGAVVLTQEKQNRILARLATLPLRYREILAGKVLGLLGLALLQCVIVVTLGRILFHVSWGSNPAALLALLICLGLAASALGTFLGGFLRSPEQAGAVGWIIPLFLCAIGGTWWPLEIVPPWLQVVGHISPAAWAMDGLHGLINFGRGASAVLVPCLVLLGYSVALTLLGSRALRVTE